MEYLEDNSRLDGEGKLKIPDKISEAINAAREDYFRIKAEGNRMILRKLPECYFCGQPEEENIFKGKQICHSCRKELIDLID